MSVKINQCAYPFIEQVKNLPVYLTGIGGTEYQGAVRRNDGYCWHQILFCADGSGTFEFDDAKINISGNSFIFIPAFYPHGYTPDNDRWDMRWVVFDGYACSEILEQLNMCRPMVVQTDNTAEMQKLYDKMFVALKTDKVYGNYTCAGIVYQYLLEFHRIASDNTMKSRTDKSDILMPVLNYIEDNFRSDFSVSVLADIAGVSQQYLCRIFNRTMNIRPNEYITCRRLQEAKHLLAETDLPVAKICIMSGFSDPGYFSTVFRRYEKIPPAEYRRQNNGMIQR